MDREGEGRADEEAELGSETWYPRNRRKRVIFFTAASVLMAVGAVVRFMMGGDPVMPILFAFLAVSNAFLAWNESRSWVEADGGALHVTLAGHTTTYPWEDIAEIRPSIAKGKRRTSLVLVRRNRHVVDLPLTDEHLDALRRWHSAST